MHYIKYGLYVTCLCLSAYTINAIAVPAQIIIVRHGEKPVGSNELSIRGQERAAALRPYLLGTQALLHYGPPVAIYAQKPDSEDPSLREIQTCIPTAKALHIKINTQYTHEQSSELAKAILENSAYANKSVLICWEHHAIPALVHSLGVKPMPQPWPGKVFDQTWVLTYAKNQQLKSFQRLQQKLLYGDSD